MKNKTTKQAPHFNAIILLTLFFLFATGQQVIAGCTDPPAPTITDATRTYCSGTCLNFASGGGSTTALILQWDDNAAFDSPTQLVFSTTTTSECISLTSGMPLLNDSLYWRIRAVDCSGPCNCFSAYTYGDPVFIPDCPPTANECANAIVLDYQETGAGPWTCSTTTGATASSVTNPACWSNNVVEDVWYKVTIPGTNLLVTTDQSLYDAIDSQLAIYSNCSSTEIDCSMDAVTDYENYAETTTGATTLTQNLTAGNTYYIRLDGDTIADGYFCIKATGVATNDCYLSAVTLYDAASPIVGTTYGATEDCDSTGSADMDLTGFDSVIDCGPGGSASVENNVWYTFYCSADGIYEINLSNTYCNGTNGVQVWSNLETATPLIFNNDPNDGELGESCNNTASLQLNSSTAFTCLAGQTVRITVDGFAGEMCSFDIGVSYSGTAAIEYLSKTESLLFPNPASERIQLKNAEQLGINQALIYDQSGRLVGNWDLNLTDSFDTEKLGNGLYTVVLKGKEKQFSQLISVLH